MNVRRPAARARTGLAVLLAVFLSGCAGSGDPPRPVADIPAATSDEAALAPSPAGPTPPALLPQAAATSVDDGAFEASDNVSEPVGSLGQEAGPADLPTDLASAPAAGATPLALAPLVGVPDGPASSLKRALAARAPSFGLRLVGADQAAGALVLKGYLTPTPREGGAAVLHVWDLYDAAGQRLYRLDGRQETGGGGAWEDIPPEAWEAIAEETLRRVAERTRARAG